MKKILLTCLLGAVSTTAMAESHNRPYVGLALGGMNSYHRANLIVATNTNNSFNASKQSFAGGILAGWMFHLASGWRLGVEADYLLTSNEPDASLNNVGGSADRVRFKSNWALGAGVRLGYKVSPATLLYVRAGMEYRKFKTYVAPKTALGINQDTSKTAFAPGVGFEVNLTPNWALGGEFRTAFYGSFTNSSSNVTSVTLKPRVDTYLINLKYKFGPCCHQRHHSQHGK